YWLAVEQMGLRPAGMLFYDLKKGEVRRGILVEEEVPPEAKKAITRGHTLTASNWEDLKEEGIQRIHELADRIDRGEFDPRPTTAVCGSCEFSSLCRRAHGYSLATAASQL